MGLESRPSALLAARTARPDGDGIPHKNTQIPFFASLLFVACFL